MTTAVRIVTREEPHRPDDEKPDRREAHDEADTTLHERSVGRLCPADIVWTPALRRDEMTAWRAPG
jgi:hypothetical protein